MKLYIVVLNDKFPRGSTFWTNRPHIRAYESEKRAQNYAKKIEGARVVEFVPKEDVQLAINKLAAQGYVTHYGICKRAKFEGDCDCGLHDALNPGEKDETK